jgi:hypothetical protein
MSWKQIRGEHNRNYNVDNTFAYDENLDVQLVSGEVTCGDGNIVFAGGRTAIYCYDTTEYELNLVWQNDNVIGDVISVMTDDILVRYVDGGVYPPITHLYALSKIDGSITWEQTFTGFFESLFYAPEVNSIIFTKKRSLGALSVATGAELWNADYSFYGLDYNDVNNQTIRGNNVLPRTTSGTIHAFSLTDGSKVWEAYPEDDLSKSFFNCYIFAQDDSSFYVQCEEIGTGLYYVLRYSFNGQYLSSFSHTHSFHRVASVGSIVYCDTATSPSPGTAVYKINDGVFSALVPSSEDSSFTISIAANNNYVFRTVYNATLGYKCEIIDLSGNVLNLGAYGGTIVLPDGDKIFIYDGSTRVIQKYVEPPPPPEPPFEGEGTEESPYLIANLTDLNNVRYFTHFAYKQVADIDMAGFNWVPFDFYGSFDFNGQTLSNLTLNIQDGAAALFNGFFGTMSGPVHLDNFNITGEYAAGLAVQYSTTRSLDLSNCSFSGQITATGSNGLAGGLFSVLNMSSADLIVSNYTCTGTIQSIQSGAGGFAARVTAGGGNLLDCSLSSATIKGISHIGSLIGYLNSNMMDINNVQSSCTLEGYDHIGGLIGAAKMQNATNCSFTGTITDTSSGGASHLGGIFGTFTGETVLKCAAQVDILSESAAYVGGVIGDFRGNVVKQTMHIGNVSGNSSIGGLIGACKAKSLDQCWAKGEVFGVHAIGGLVGGLDYNSEDGVIVKDSYAVSSLVQGQDSVGGLVGNFRDDPMIAFINCYAAAVVVSTGSPKYGGLLGPTKLIETTVTSCYYDSTVSGLTDDTGRGVPKTTAEMKSQATFIGWDFETVWAINSSVNQGYPYLGSAIPPIPTPLPPEITILGVEDGVVYAEPVTPVVNIVNAETSTITFYKNGIETDFLSGTTIDKNGIYSLNVLAQNEGLIALASVTFQIAIAPKITVLGVEDDMVYSETDLPLTPDAIITDAEEYSVTLLKDGMADPEFRLGDNLRYSWNYVLIISAINAPLQTTVVVNFTIDVQPAVNITGVTNGAAYIKEPVKPNAVITNAENSDYTLIKYDKEITRYRLGRDTLAQTGDYFLTVTAINGHNEASDSVAFSLYMDDYSLPEIPDVTEDPGDPIVITDPLVKAFRNVHHFKNYQFLDTGYRKHNPEYKKRYRECQFRLNNVSQKQQHFYTAFLIDGDRRRSFMKYNLQHNIDPEDPEYGLITMVPEWVDPTIVPGVTVLGKETSDVNAWQLDVSTFPDRSLWKVRIPVSGKGYAPRLQLLSKSEQAYELLSITWVARMLNSR